MVTRGAKRWLLAVCLVLPACSAVLGLRDLTPAEADAGADAGDASASSDADASLLQEGGCADLLTSPDHCGRCGHSCLGGACVDGGCQPVELASGQGEVGGVAVDGTSVYFTSLTANVVARVGKDGGTVQPYASGAPIVKDARRIAVDATHVYWVDSELGDGAVVRCPLAGCAGAPEVLAHPEEPTGLAVDPKHVVWADRNGSVIGRWALPSGPESVFANAPDLPVSVAVDGDEAFFVTDFSGRVFRRNATDGGVDELGANGQSGRVLVMDARFVYWGAAQDYGQLGNVTRMPRAGGAIELLARAGGDPMGMGLDDAHLYWTAWDRKTDGTYVAGAVHACALVGGCPKGSALVSADKPRGIAVDDAAIYFGANGSVLRLAKP